MKMVSTRDSSRSTDAGVASESDGSVLQADAGVLGRKRIHSDHAVHGHCAKRSRTREGIGLSDDQYTSCGTLVYENI